MRSKSQNQKILYAPVGGKKRPAYFVPQKKSFVNRATAGSFLELVKRLVKCPRVSGQVPKSVKCPTASVWSSARLHLSGQVPDCICLLSNQVPDCICLVKCPSASVGCLCLVKCPQVPDCICLVKLLSAASVWSSARLHLSGQVPESVWSSAQDGSVLIL